MQRQDYIWELTFSYFQTQHDYEASVIDSESLVLGSCDLVNGCETLKCENGGRCRHVTGSSQVFCDCDNTGHSGAVCRTSHHWRSCDQYLEWSRSRSGEVMIDVDGPGPLSPSLVTCSTHGTLHLTLVSHSSMEPTKVDNYFIIIYNELKYYCIIILLYLW